MPTHLLRGFRVQVCSKVFWLTFGCGLVRGPGLAGPVTRFRQSMWVRETWWTHDVKRSGHRLPEGAATMVEVLTDLNGLQSTQEGDSGTWMMWSVLCNNGGCPRQVWWQRHLEKRCTAMLLADCWVETEVLCTRETQGSTQRRRATNRVDERCLDDLAQRKRVGIHDSPLGQQSGWALWT